MFKKGSKVRSTFLFISKKGSKVRSKEFDHMLEGSKVRSNKKWGLLLSITFLLFLYSEVFTPQAKGLDSVVVVTGMLGKNYS
jgi:hypothetical protein